MVILTCLVEDHAYLLGAYRQHPFLVVDPCLVVYSMDVLEVVLSYHLEAYPLEAYLLEASPLEEGLSYHLEAYPLEAYPLVALTYLVLVHRGLELLMVYHLASYFIFFPWLLLST